MITLKLNTETTQDLYSQILKVYEIKAEKSMKILATIKSYFSNFLTKSKYCDDSNKSVVGKMKHETSGVAIENFVGLKPKMHSFFVDDNSEHKKVKGMNKNNLATIGHNEYKDVLLNKKSLRHSMNRTFIEQERMKSTKFHCLALMTKYVFKIFDMID